MAKDAPTSPFARAMRDEHLGLRPCPPVDAGLAHVLLTQAAVWVYSMLPAASELLTPPAPLACRSFRIRSSKPLSRPYTALEWLTEKRKNREMR